jgi:diadenylate cyclase
MIEWLWELLIEFKDYLFANYDPIRDTVDVALVALGIYWLLLLIRGTRAVQIVVGLIVLAAMNVIADVFQLVTVKLILDGFIPYAVVIIVILFQNDIRRALARVGRGFFPGASAAQESQLVEEVVRAAQVLSQRRVGALIVLERETGLDDQIEAGSRLDAEVSKDLLVSIFLPQSPLHDGAVVIQGGRTTFAGTILPLTLKTDLPEGVGTRHRAAVGITEETDAVVVVVSEETASISVVMGGEIAQNLEAPKLREVLSEIMGSDRRDLPPSALAAARPLVHAPARVASAPTGPTGVSSAGSAG